MEHAPTKKAHPAGPRVEQYRARPASDVMANEDSYKGLRISAHAGLHDVVAQRLMEVVPPGGHVLDVAGGTGAMSRRLLDLGYRVTAIEYTIENFALKDEVTCHALDLNGDFPEAFDARFDGILGVEIIEHLENPRAFLRGLEKLLAPGGRIILTTPNADNPVSRALYVRLGYFMWFQDTAVQNLGHITPVSPRLLRQACADVGLQVDSLESFGDPWTQIRTWPSMRMLAKVLDWIGNRDPKEKGEILVATLSAAD